MRVAVIGSRGITKANIGAFLPQGVTEIVSGGAKGVDTCAAEYAAQNEIKLTVFLPDYNRYRKGAPLKRNIQIIEYADEVIAFWNGKSAGTKYVIDECKRQGKKITVYYVADDSLA